MPSNQKKYGLGKKDRPFEHSLPSGEVCLMRRAQIDDLISMGALDQADGLTALVNDLHITRVKTGRPAEGGSVLDIDRDDPETMKRMVGIISDPERWGRVVDLADKVTVHCVLDPKVSPDSNDKDGALFVGEVDLMDRLSIMTAALSHLTTEAAKMAPFRSGPQEAVGDLEAVKDLPLPAEQSASDPA